MELSIVLPFFNEQENLQPLIDEIDAALRPLKKSYEIVAVDDGSTDKSRAVIKELAATRPHLKLVAFRRNTGQTAALNAGFHFAHGKTLITLDADGQNDPKDIPQLLEKLDEGFDCVTGWRNERKDKWLSRKLPSRIANWLTRRVTRTQVHDLGCTLRAYRREIVSELRLYGEMHRFLVVLIEGLGGRVGEIKVNHRPRTRGTSKYGISRAMKVPLDLLTIWFTHAYRTKPIYLFGGVGLTSLVIGGSMAMLALYEKFAGGVWVHKNPVFILSVMFTGIGGLFLGLGLLAEILVRTYFESQNIQPYSVSESPQDLQSPSPAVTRQALRRVAVG